jgi:hypothetical protein
MYIMPERQKMNAKKALEIINADPKHSLTERMAARAILSVKESNGHVDIDAASASLGRKMQIPDDQAKIYVTDVYDEALDMARR